MYWSCILLILIMVARLLMIILIFIAAVWIRRTPSMWLARVWHHTSFTWCFVFIVVICFTLMGTRCLASSMIEMIVSSIVHVVPSCAIILRSINIDYLAFLVHLRWARLPLLLMFLLLTSTTFLLTCMKEILIMTKTLLFLLELSFTICLLEPFLFKLSYCLLHLLSLSLKYLSIHIMVVWVFIRGMMRRRWSSMPWTMRAR